MNKDIMIAAGFKKEVSLVGLGKCLFCKKEVNLKDFKDLLSMKEFKISGICQKCQDKTFS